MNMMILNLLFLTEINETILYWLLIVPIILVFGLMIVAIVVRFVKMGKQTKRNKEAPFEVDSDQQSRFYEAYGSKENIVSVKRELSRITVIVNDWEKVDTNLLQELGASGVLIAGNSIKASFGDRSEFIEKILQ